MASSVESRRGAVARAVSASLRFPSPGNLEKPMDDRALLELVRKGIAKASNGTKG